MYGNIGARVCQSHELQSKLEHVLYLQPLGFHAKGVKQITRKKRQHEYQLMADATPEYHEVRFLQLEIKTMQWGQEDFAEPCK